MAAIECDLIDLRGQQAARPDLCDPDNYSASQAFGVALRWSATATGENGTVYDSVRRGRGTNVNVYRPSLIILPVIQADHYQYCWDAARQASILKLTNVPADRPE